MEYLQRTQRREVDRDRNSQLLADRLPNAHLRIYSDANHGFLNQYPELFADHVRAFLAAG
jgi:pimeloyl-ACP methyl ester carboxylesterase